MYMYTFDSRRFGDITKERNHETKERNDLESGAEK